MTNCVSVLVRTFLNAYNYLIDKEKNYAADALREEMPHNFAGCALPKLFNISNWFMP
jgi:hypothetical protein